MEVRRRHVPAFGEWNYYCDEVPIADYYAQEGSEVWFKSSSPPSRKPVKKVRRDGVAEKQCSDKGIREGREADGGVRMPAKVRRVVRAVDADLYQVPPDFISQKPRRKRVARSLWMGCLGNCIA